VTTVESYFSCEETSNVKTKNFVSVTHPDHGENNRTVPVALKRVCGLSWNLPFFKAKPRYAARTIQALNIAREEMTVVMPLMAWKTWALGKS